MPVDDDRTGARKLRSARFWRLLDRLLPVGQRLNRFIAWFVAPRGLIAVPWGRHWLTIDAAWLGIASSASAPVYQTPRRQNPELFALVAPMLKRCGQGAVVDIGANIGIYTIGLRGMTDAPIIAFEPEPSIFALLTRNVRDNGLSSVKLRNVACGDHQHVLRFRSGINGEMAAETGGDAIFVPVVRLDDELRGEAVAFIKIDCEGYEWQVLGGCRELIAMSKPKLFVELHPKLIARYGHSLRDVCDLLRPDYNLEFWEPDPALRSRWRLRRLFARYRSALRRLDSEQAMLQRATSDRAPDQIFLCARPH